MVVYPSSLIAYQGEHLPEAKTVWWVPSFDWEDLNSLCSAYQTLTYSLRVVKALVISLSQGASPYIKYFIVYQEEDKIKYIFLKKTASCRLEIWMLSSNKPWIIALASKTSNLCSGVSCNLHNHSLKQRFMLWTKLGHGAIAAKWRQGWTLPCRWLNWLNGTRTGICHSCAASTTVFQVCVILDSFCGFNKNNNVSFCCIPWGIQLRYLQKGVWH